MKIDKKKYPLVVLRGMNKLRKEIHSIFIKNSELLIWKDSEDELLHLGDKEEKFRFIIKLPDSISVSTNVINYLVQILPSNQYQNGEKANEYLMTNNQILIELEKWIENIKEYENINFDVNAQHLLFYENEYFSSIKSLDTDADINPFNLEQQKELDIYLEIIEKALLDQQKPETRLIALEVANVRNEVPLRTKNQTLGKISKISGKIKLLGNKLAKDIIDVAKKELIKAALKQFQDVLFNLLT